jgi:hypothetical protein
VASPLMTRTWNRPLAERDLELSQIVPKRNRSSKGTCIFCGRFGPLTNEDAVPTWLMKILSPAGLSWGVTGGQLQGNLRKVPTGYRLKVAALCVACNNTWLSPIENRAKPKLMSWMAGISSPLTVEEQKLLSFWAVKTAMTVQLAQSRTQHVIPMDQYPALHRARTQPPPGFYVWIQAQPPEWKGVNVYANRPVLTNLGPAYEIRLEFRHLHLRLVGCHVAHEDQIAKTVSELQGFDRTMHQIWPASSRLLLTPPFGLSTGNRSPTSQP